MGWPVSTGWFLLLVSRVVVAGKHLELEPSESLISLNIKGDFFFIHIRSVSEGMARTARAWLGISFYRGSPHGFLSRAVSRAWTSYRVAGLLLSEHSTRPRWRLKVFLRPSLGGHTKSFLPHSIGQNPVVGSSWSQREGPMQEYEYQVVWFTGWGMEGCGHPWKLVTTVDKWQTQSDSRTLFYIANMS